MKRVFIVIELTEEIKQNLIKVQKNFQDLPAKLVRPQHMHLTLVFLGNVKEDKISRVIQVCQKVAQNFKPFVIKFQGISAFPIITRANNFWIAIKDCQNLVNLQKQLSLGLKDLGFKIEDRKFHPHLTLARFRQKENLKNRIKQFQNQNFGKMKVENFYIFESKLLPKGPEHKIIKKLKIQSSNDK